MMHPLPKITKIKDKLSGLCPVSKPVCTSTDNVNHRLMAEQDLICTFTDMLGRGGSVYSSASNKVKAQSSANR